MNQNGNVMYNNLKLTSTETFSFAAVVFCVFLLLFPIDSALGNILGSISINNYIAILCVICAIVFCNNRLRLETNNLFLIVLYVAFILITILYSPSSLSNNNILVIFYIVMATILCQVKWSAKEKQAFIITSILGMLLAVIIVFVNIRADDYGRVYVSLSRDIDQNYLSANFILASVILGNCIAKSKYKVVYFCFLIIEFVAILFLGSRGGLISNILAAFLAYTISTKKMDKILLLVLLLIVAYFIVIEVLPGWISYRFNIYNIITSTGSGRTVIWGQFWDIYSHGSILNLFFGYGRGSIYHFMATGDTYNCTHNIFLKALVEGGLVGLCISVAIIFMFFRFVGRNTNKSLYALLVGYLVCGMFLDLDDYRIAYVLAMFVVMFANTNLYVSFNASKLRMNRR